MSVRRPKGYVGKNHETIGSDLMAVLAVVSMPQQTLGTALHSRLSDVKAEGWYPIELLLELMTTLDARVGKNGLRQMGRKLFQLSHEAHVTKTFSSAAQILGGFDALYHRANRGEGIGGWKLLSWEPGRARLEKTTPHHCALEEGIVMAALNCVNVPGSVSQEQCLRDGADCCILNITSVVRDGRWGTL